MIAAEGKTRQDDQSEALTLTGLFKERFEQTVPPEGISKPVEQTSTNQPAGTNTTEVILSAEDRAKIVTLTDQAITAQTSARDAASTNLAVALPHQRKAYTLLKEIEKLLPKEKQPQDNSQQQDQKDNPQKQDQPKEPPKEPPKEQKKPEKQEPQKGEMSKDDLQRMLEKAKQREKEHEQEKRERNNSIPMSPAERDW